MNATVLKPSLKKFDEAQPGDFVYEPEYGDPMTKQEFIDLAEGNLVVARNLFDCCEWQHPATLIDEHGGPDFFRPEPVDVDRQMAEAIAQQDTNFKRTHEAIGLHVTALSKFMPTAQLKTMIGLVNGEEGAFFSEKLDELHMLVDTMPKTYGQDGMGDEAVAYLHYFKNGADWYITERDMEDEQLQAFGLADLFGDGGELGYISIEELKSVGAEFDLYWSPKTLREIKQPKSAPRG